MTTGTHTVSYPDTTVKLAMDSLWKYNGNDTINIHCIAVSNHEDDCGDIEVLVKHDADWTIYTDSAFPKAISKLLGFDVHWSEQGSQYSDTAHLFKS